MTSPEEIRELRAHLSKQGRVLASLTLARRARAIDLALRGWLVESSRAPDGLRQQLMRSTGLCDGVVQHGLETTLGLFTASGLITLHDDYARLVVANDRAPSGALAVCVLAGNVFSAAVRPMVFPLLCGHPVLVKASSEDDVLPRALQDALANIDQDLGRACAVVGFGREDVAHTSALLQGAELVSIYGSDETVSELSAVVNQQRVKTLGRVSSEPPARIVAHGHGLGAAYVGKETLRSRAEAEATASALARDVAAYDQRGCLSPQAILVERSAGCDGRAFAALLADALERVAQQWPRGTLSASAAAEQLQWRGVAAAAYELHVRDSAAVAYEADGPLRASPGYRNVSVYDCDGVPALRARLRPLGAHLKALGVAGADARTALADLAPYVCELGKMQEPPLQARLDGLHPLHGF